MFLGRYVGLCLKSSRRGDVAQFEEHEGKVTLGCQRIAVVLAETLNGELQHVPVDDCRPIQLALLSQYFSEAAKQVQSNRMVGLCQRLKTLKGLLENSEG